jgi:hypothetical protein
MEGQHAKHLVFIFVERMSDARGSLWVWQRKERVKASVSLLFLWRVNLVSIGSHLLQDHLLSLLIEDNP